MSNLLGVLQVIEWVDCSGPSEGGWVDPDLYDCLPLSIISCGWVLDESDTAVQLISSCSPGSGNAEVQGLLTIPKCQITKRSSLTRKHCLKPL